MPLSDSHRRLLRVAGWAVLLFVVLFWRLGAATFWDPDEAIYAEASREMARSGDYGAAFYNGTPFFDKPVVFYWLQASAMNLVGHNEFGVRLVPALAALAIVGLTAWTASLLAGAEVATLAALIMATSPPLFALARYAILDTLFTAVLFGASSLVAVGIVRNRPGLQYPAYALVGLAVLIKGPLGLALTGLTFLLAAAASPDARKRLFDLRFVIGLLLALVIAAPWFVYMYLRFRQAFVDGYFLNENIKLFATSMYAKQPPWYFYIQIMATSLLPWTPLVLGRLVDTVRGLLQKRQPDLADVLLWSWTVAIMGFFSFSEFKLDHYVFPAAPALAILCARAWADVCAHPDDEAVQWSRWGAMLVGPLFLAAGLGVAGFMIVRLDLPTAALVAPLAIAAAGAIVTAAMNLRRGDARTAPAWIPGAMVVVYAMVLVFVLPMLEQKKVVPEVAAWVASHAGPSDRVASFRLNRWRTAYRFYVDRPVEQLDDETLAQQYFAADSPFYCAMLQPEFARFVQAGARLKVVYVREGMWATSGRALWRKAEKPTRFLVVTNASSPLPEVSLKSGAGQP